jgi:hypothetical protein
MPIRSRSRSRSAGAGVVGCLAERLLPPGRVFLDRARQILAVVEDAANAARAEGMVGRSAVEARPPKATG